MFIVGWWRFLWIWKMKWVCTIVPETFHQTSYYSPSLTISDFMFSFACNCSCYVIKVLAILLFMATIFIHKCVKALWRVSILILFLSATFTLPSSHYCICKQDATGRWFENLEECFPPWNAHVKCCWRLVASSVNLQIHQRKNETHTHI